MPPRDAEVLGLLFLLGEVLVRLEIEQSGEGLKSWLGTIPGFLQNYGLEWAL